MKLKVSEMAFSKAILLAVVIILVVAVAGSFLTFDNSGIETQSGGSSNQSYSAFSVAENGIKLNVTISPDSMASGETFNLTETLFNTLSTTNNASAISDWPLSTLIGFCKGGVLNTAFYAGHVTSSNIDSATFLPEYGPGAVSCPAASQNVSAYSFSPKSDVATYFVGYPVTAQVSSCTTLTQSQITLSNGSKISPVSTSCDESVYTSLTSTQYSATESASFSWGQGYYDASESSFIDFPAGQYSVVVGDIWNDYVILYFTVT